MSVHVSQASQADISDILYILISYIQVPIASAYTLAD